MFIVLDIFEGQSTKIYAAADDLEDAWNESRVVEIWHNPKKVGLHHMDKDRYEQLADHEYCVTFKSTVPFVKFCDAFVQSSYYNPGNYNYYSHNCANGAHFALSLAGIQLQFPRIKWTKILVGSYFKIPTLTLTPTDLFNSAKQYKNKDLSSLQFKSALAVNALRIWSKKQENERIKSHILTICNECTTLFQKRPHQAEIYIANLIAWIDLVSRTHDIDAYVRTRNFQKRFFREREFISSTKASIRAKTRALDLHILICLSSLLINSFRTYFANEEQLVENGWLFGDYFSNSNIYALQMLVNIISALNLHRTCSLSSALKFETRETLLSIAAEGLVKEFINESITSSQFKNII